MSEVCTICGRPLGDLPVPVQYDLDGAAAHVACIETVPIDEEEDDHDRNE